MGPSKTKQKKSLKNKVALPKIVYKSNDIMVAVKHIMSRA